MADPMVAWLSFLASPAASKVAMSALELDGYLTGIVVAPQPTPITPTPIMPGQWIAGLRGDEPVFEDEAQIGLVLRAVMDRYNTLALDIDRSLKRLEAERVCDYRPMFVPSEGKPAHDAVRSWARGFWKAMTLAPETWSALAAGERGNILIEPFVGFFDLDDQGPIEIPDNVDAILDESVEAIPQTILVLHKLAKMRSRSSPPARQSKVGRNDPCPCGSGQKYKHCCSKD